MNVKLPTIIMHTWVEGKRKHLNPIVLATVTTWNHEIKKKRGSCRVFFLFIKYAGMADAVIWLHNLKIVNGLL